MGNAKADALTLIQKMPDDATWETVLYRVYIRAKVEQGMAEIDAGKGIPHEQVMQEMEEWLASFGAPLPASTSNGT